MQVSFGVSGKTSRVFSSDLVTVAQERLDALSLNLRRESACRKFSFSAPDALSVGRRAARASLLPSAREGVEAAQVSRAAVFLADNGVDEFPLQAERAVDPRHFGPDRPRATRGDVSGVNDIRCDVTFRAGLVPQRAAGGVNDVRAKSHVEESVVGRMVGIGVMHGQACDSADDTAKAAGGIAVFDAAGAWDEDTERPSGPVVKDRLANLSAGLDARRNGLERGGWLHERDVPTAGNQVQSHRRLELPNLQVADEADVAEAKIAFVEGKLIRRVAQFDKVAHGQNEDAVAARKEVQPTELNAIVEIGQVAAGQEPGAVHLESGTERAAQFHLFEVEVTEGIGARRQDRDGIQGIRERYSLNRFHV